MTSILRATLFVLVAALAVLTGCSSTTHLYVKSTAATNDGNTLYMMVREAEGKGTTVAERYQEMATRLFADPPEPSVIAKVPIFPGNTANLTIENPDRDVIVYFFFTNPGTNWRLPLRKPLPSEIYIDLGQNQIQAVQVKRR